MRWIVMVLMLFTLLAADHDRERDEHLPFDISYLGLNETQHEEVERIVRSHREDHRRFKRHKRETREAINRLFTAERFDEARFVELSQALRGDAAAMQARFLGALHNVLTPEQRRRFAHYMEEWEIE